MLKKLLLFQVIFFYLSIVNAQGWDRVKLLTEVGFPIGTTSENLGFLFHAEPKLQVSENSFMGMRIAMAINSQTFKNHDRNQFIINEEFDHGFFSIIPTFDYYWLKEGFCPYLGIGAGPYSLANTIDVFRVNSTNNTENVFEVEVGYRIGFLFRGGFELRKLRFGLEYNFVPKTTVELPNSEQKIGTVNSSYLGMSLGLIIGACKQQ